MFRKVTTATVIALAVAAPAGAADFTFDVPVNVSNIPQLSRIRVDCTVSVLPAGTDGWAADSNVIGRGSTTVDVTGGSFNDTVQVTVENRGTRRSSEARSYDCYLTGTARNSAGYDVVLEYGMWSRTLERITGAALASENTETAVNLP